MNTKKYFAYRAGANRIKDRMFTLEDATQYNRENPGKEIVQLHAGFESTCYKWNGATRAFEEKATGYQLA
jgi:hypothetical protein